MELSVANPLDPLVKIKYTIDALFGTGVSKTLPKSVEFTFSRKNGRIREVYHDKKLLCTLRIDGGLAISTHFAQIMLKNKKFKQNCIEIDDDSEPFVRNGKSVFCNHVTWAGKNIQIGADVPVVYKKQVIAVGRAIVNSQMMMDMKRGVAVKVRDSLKNSLEQNNL